jgi:hypothetical protein
VVSCNAIFSVGVPLIIAIEDVMVHPISWADVGVLSSFGIVKEDAESMAVPAM